MSAGDAVMFAVAGGIALYLAVGVAQGFAWLLWGV
jgi:hypothetical protein